jgi:hypothetical protein
MDQGLRQMQQHQSMENIFRATRFLFETLYKYKFLMLNFVDIMRRNSKINKHYRELQTRRNSEFKMIFKELIAAGLMRPELYPGYFDNFMVNMMIIGDFWISHAEIMYTGQEKNKLDYYYQVTSGLLLPLLTEKGLAFFLKSAGKQK